MKDRRLSTPEPEETWVEDTSVTLFGIWTLSRGRFVLLLLLCVLLLGGGLFAYLRSQMGAALAQAPGEAPRVEPASPATGDVVSDLVSVLRRHIAATQRDPTASLAITGTYRTSDIDFSLDVLSKQPALFRQTLSYKKARIVAGFDGGHYWQDNPVAKATGDASAASDVNRDLLILESSLLALVWQFETNGLRGLSLMESTTLNGRTCDLIENRDLLEYAVFHYIDRQTGFELCRRVTILKRGVPLEVVIAFDYDWAAFPVQITDLDGYTISMNGMQVAQANFESVRLNPGVMPWMFQQPSAPGSE